MSEYTEMAELLFEISDNISNDQYLKLFNLLKKIKDKNLEKNIEDKDIESYYMNRNLDSYYMNIHS